VRKAEQIQKFKEGCLALIEGFKEIKSKKEKYFWGLDISLSNTGLTVVRYEEIQHFSHKQKGERYQRLHLIEKDFEKHVSDYPPKLVVIEGYAFGARQSREILGEAGYAVKRCFTYREGFNYPCLTVSPMSLKKFVLNKAKGVSKNELHKFVQNEWGADTKNNDESDSYVLCIIGMNIYQTVLKVKEIIKGNEDSENYWKGLFDNAWQGVELEDFQWEVIRNIIMNDGINFKRFYP
jgi:Holliday junction resolvasome RuvABC endonuclease subunit